jgi:hypothetical protein
MKGITERTKSDKSYRAGQVGFTLVHRGGKKYRLFIGDLRTVFKL